MKRPVQLSKQSPGGPLPPLPQLPHPPQAFYRPQAEPATQGFTPFPMPAPAQRSRRYPLVVALVAIVVVAGGIGVYFAFGRHSGGPVAAASQSESGGSVQSALATGSGGLDGGFGPGGSGSSLPTSAPTTSEAKSNDPAAAASEINAIVDQSVSARSGVQPALVRIQACEAGQSDIDVLSHARSVRQRLLEKLSTISFDNISGGSELGSRLSDLLSDSANADAAYVQWGENQAGCGGEASRDSAKARGDDYSNQATVDKRAFVDAWNPIAAQYGFPTRNQADI